MKKITSIITVAAAAVLLSPLCFAGSTATLVNDTAYSCPGYPVDMSQCTKSEAGVSIQPRDAMFQPSGPAISVGNAGQAPVVKQGETSTIMASTPDQKAAVYQGQAVAGQTYHMVSAPAMISQSGGYWISDVGPK